MKAATCGFRFEVNSGADLAKERIFLDLLK